MKKYKLSFLLLSLILISCTGNNNPPTLLVTPAYSPSRPVPIFSPTTTPIPTSTPLQKPYTMPNIKNTFLIADQIQLSNFVTTSLDDNGNGMFVFRGSAQKISNFKPSGERFSLDSDNDFGESSITLNEKGDGMIIWQRAPVATTGFDTIPPEFFYLKYLRIKNYKPVGEPIKLNNRSENNLTLNAKFNLDESGNGRVIFISKYNDDIKVTTFNVQEYIISPNKEKTIDFQGLNIYIDKNGNGFLTRLNEEGKIILIKVKNLIAESKEIPLGEKNKIESPYQIKVDFDINGNGYVSWSYEYVANTDYSISDSQRGELIIKKLDEFNLTRDEISLGNDYGSNGNGIKLDQNGNGIVYWASNYPLFKLHVREIKSYTPQIPVTIDNNNNFIAGYGVSINNFGDGLITWQSHSYRDSALLSKYYGRLITNYTISKDGTTSYTPNSRPTIQPALPSFPPPLSTPVPNPSASQLPG